MKLFRLCRNILLAIFAFLTSSLGLLAFTNLTFVQAEVKYLTVKQSDFTVDSFGIIGDYYKIMLSYNGASETGLPHKSSYQYQEKNTTLDTNDEEKLNLWYLSSANSSPYFLALTIHLNYSADGKIGYTEANPTEIRIPVGASFTSSTNYKGGEYGGIYFEDGLSLVFDENTQSWICAVAEETPTIREEAVTLNETNVSSFGINEATGLLQAEIALPYAHTDTATYEGEISATVSGVKYTGTISAYHVANTQTLLLVFNGSENICKAPQGVSVTLLGGVLTSTEIGIKLILDGELTFYGYSDKTFSTQEYIEIHKSVAGVETLEKVPASEENYVLEEMEAPSGKLFWGWKFGEETYKSGDTLALTAYKSKGVYLDAVFLEYGLLSGATIRCDKVLTSSGIRFSANLSEIDYLGYQSVIRGVGIILMPSDLIGEKEFVLENYSGNNEAKNFYAEANRFSFDETGVFRLHATLATVLESNYNRSFSARAYMLVNRNGAEEYLWGSEIVTRSVYEVATKALQANKRDNDLAGNQVKILEAYVNGVANITYDGETASIVCEAETPVISAVEVPKNGSTVTLIFTTDKEKFAAITYNGKRVRGATQVYADGKLTVTFAEVE